jgi:hypothetical protein
MRFARSCILAALIGSVGVGCSAKPPGDVSPQPRADASPVSTKPPDQQKPSTTVEDRPPPREIVVPEDRSLSIQEYLQWECPPPDRPWGVVDLFKLKTAFTTKPLLDGKKRPPVPRYNSKRSGELFARITSAQNLDRVRDRSVPVKNRLDFATAYVSTFVSIYELYGQAFLQHEVGDSEMVEICGLYLQLAARWKELVDESLQETPKDDPAYRGFVEGAENGKKGWAVIVNLGLTALEDKENYRASERQKLLGYMKETVPALAPGLAPDARDDLLRRLQRMMTDPHQKSLHDEMKDLRGLILMAGQAK